MDFETVLFHRQVAIPWSSFSRLWPTIHEEKAGAVLEYRHQRCVLWEGEKMCARIRALPEAKRWAREGKTSKLHANKNIVI